MASLKKLVSNRRTAHYTRGSQNTGAEAVGLGPKCPFCGRREASAGTIGSSGHPIWRCHCGAIASGSPARELEEVADQLLQILGGDGAIGGPVIITGHLDADNAIDTLRDLLKSHGFEVRTSVSRTQKVIWIATQKPLNYW